MCPLHRDHIGDEDVHLAPEEDNEHDDFAIAIFFEVRIVGHVPRNFSMVLNWKLQVVPLHAKSLINVLTEEKGYGLEIPVAYEFDGWESCRSSQQRFLKYLKL